MEIGVFASILDTISEGVVVFGPDGKVSYCNQAFFDIIGFDRPEMAGSLCSIMQGLDADRATIEAIDAAIHSGVAFSSEIQNNRESGEAFWTEFTVKPEFAEDCSICHFVGTLRDITTQKNAELAASIFEKAVLEKSREIETLSANLRNAQRIAKVGIFDYSVKNDLQHWSEELIEMLGFPKEKFPAPSNVFTSRIDESDLPLFQELFNRAIDQGMPYELTVKVHRYTGGAMYMQIIADVRDVGDDRRITGIARDVTEETKAAEQLFDEKQRFELAARATQDVVFEWNIETGEYWANAAFQAVYGYEAPSHINLDNLDSISAVAADHDQVRRVTLEAIASGRERYSVDYRFIRPDGSYGHVAVRGFIVRNKAGKPLRIIGTGTDIGQLSDAMSALEASEERFRLIADTVSDVLWDRNFDNNAMWVTPDWPDRLHVSIDHDVTQDMFFLKHVEPEDSSRVKKSFLEAIKSDAAEWEIQYVLVGNDGVRIDLAVKAAILRHPDGKAHRMLGNARNVTFEKRQHEGYTRGRALEAVGQLTGGVAHDFNNLLMIILGNLELLEMSNLGEEDAKTVASIGQAAESAARLTRQLLTFARQAQLNRTRVDVNALVADTVPLLRAGLPETIKVNQSAAPDLWPIDIDANGLQQAIVNLAMNANDAMARGGEIVVTCSNLEVSEDMVPANVDLRPGRYVAISVSDTGEGMKPEVQARAFEPFYTTKDVGKGTGLGLSTVYGFAKQSNGGVSIYSEPGCGTTVNLYLPAAEVYAFENHYPEHGIAVEMPLRPKRILVVEDQPQVRSHVQKTLLRFGCVVETAQDAVAALAMLKHGEAFDLLFTDIIMPGGMNGQELGEAALRIVPQIKILYTSGYPSAAFEHLGLKEQTSINFLSKPYKAVDLQRVLTEIFDDQSHFEGSLSG